MAEFDRSLLWIPDAVCKSSVSWRYKVSVGCSERLAVKYALVQVAGSRLFSGFLLVSFRYLKLVYLSSLRRLCKFAICC